MRQRECTPEAPCSNRGRRLSKALTGFNVKGCLTDVANLAFAMVGIFLAGLYF